VNAIIANRKNLGIPVNTFFNSIKTAGYKIARKFLLTRTFFYDKLFFVHILNFFSFLLLREVRKVLMLYTLTKYVLTSFTGVLAYKDGMCVKITEEISEGGLS
jgi:hypothetical protein